MIEDNNLEEQEESQEGLEETSEESSSQEEQKEGEEVNIMAALSYLGILVIIPILTNKEDEFVKFHIKQGLVLLITAVVAMFVGVVPILGWIIAPLVSLACLVLAIIGIINVLGGKKKQLPLIGQYAEKIKI